ncbi:class C sortase [Bacillus thuringiensis serovar kyushuensis]|uniref:class C sortase n=1 Tax=Bacillus thuringiensis TaxID=1428 RepID=UPI000B44F6CC|nr:class C sortase [Bacillus thuringiensis]MEC2864372.1 class C sortase [Bacillus cereus]OTZ61006.1 class C sortase [Bacillus thuringiensis serovar kyushuensis]OTZ64353.1 class C sortase [Bacillus thuringiensis serovar tohokuensis]OUB88341.1 class C sortase [Bacillus thuringiensis serovar indiana]
MKRNIIFGIIFFLGLCIFLYPTVSNWMATRAHYSEISSYDETVKSLEKEEIERRERAAKEYNKKVQSSTQTFSDPFNEKNNQGKSYVDILNLGEVMGYVEVPKINIKLPIYQGTSEKVLSRGIGRLEESSLPVGGESTHTVLTGHRGLPSAIMFTHLDKIEKGDMFYIHSLDKILVYKVDQIKTVLPNEIEDLVIVPNEDYATLITCTPYGVNTHRLLVRGERVPNEAKEKEVVTKTPILEEWMIIIPIAFLAFSVFVIFLVKRKQKKFKTL